jgi:predicted O-methyltransferase YrrM
VTNQNQKQWTAIDEFLAKSLLGDDPVLQSALNSSAVGGLPEIQVSACQGKMLHLLARVRQAGNILEIGTLGGYSTLWLARALAPGGRLVTLELDPHHAKVAKANFQQAGLSHLIDLRVGPASESLAKLVAEGQGPFDFIFIDADKPGTAEYFSWALRLSRVGSIIIVDNVIRKGALLDPTTTGPAVLGMRRFIEMLSAQAGVESTVIQTVGSKGYDGFALILVTGEEARTAHGG